MASTPDSFKNRLIPILQAAGITDPATLEFVASSFSQALHEYVTQDVEVAAGQPVQVSLTNGKGATSGPGKLF